MKQISSLLDICSEIKFKDMQRIVCKIQMCMTKIFIIQDPWGELFKQYMLFINIYDNTHIVVIN